jgi:hypothetical protein
MTVPAVHRAGTRREGFEVWTGNRRRWKRAVSIQPFLHRRRNGAFTEAAPGFTGKRISKKGRRATPTTP